MVKNCGKLNYNNNNSCYNTTVKQPRPRRFDVQFVAREANACGNSILVPIEHKADAGLVKILLMVHLV